MVAFSVEEFWHDKNWYDFLSSEAGGVIVKLIGLIVVVGLVRWGGKFVKKEIEKHLECHVTSCHSRGFVVHGTPYRACHLHHPLTEHEPGGTIKEAHIHKAHLRFKGRN